MFCHKGKKFFVFFILILISSYAFCKNNFEIAKIPKIELKTAVTVPVKKSLKNEKPSFSSFVSCDFSVFSIENGFSVSSISSDSLINIFFKPLSLDWFELGLGFCYHFYDYYKVFMEHDILSKNYFAFICKDIVRVQFNFGTLRKFTNFKNVPITNNLYKDSIYLGADIFLKIKDIFKFNIGVNSIDYFDYQLLGTPFFKFGFGVSPSEYFQIGFDYSVKLIDMIAVAENISEMLFGIYVKVSL